MATKIARSMVTEYGMSAKLGAVKYGSGDDEPFLGRTYGHQAEYSIEAAREIDEAVRALIEAAHNEAWAVLNSNRLVLDRLAGELLEKETVERKELEVIFEDVEKRPRITDFDDFGARTPSDQPPIKTPGELAIERGEPWPPPAPPRRPRGIETGAPPAAPAPAPQSGVPVPAGAITGGYAGPPGGAPPNWSGGVLPGPLGPMPGWGAPPAAGIVPGGVGGVPGGAPQGYANGANGANGYGAPYGQQNGHAAPQGAYGVGPQDAPQPGADGAASQGEDGRARQGLNPGQGQNPGQNPGQGQNPAQPPSAAPEPDPWAPPEGR
jgi:cell division protease FtsH